MIRVVLSCLLIALIPVSLYSQEVILGFHGSFPLGEDAATDDDGGFARTGYGGIIESYYRFSSWPEPLYAGLFLSYQTNDIDGAKLAELFNETFGGQLTTTVSRSRYRPLTLLLGPLYRFRLSEKFSLDGKAGVGMMISNIDPIRFNFFDDQGALIVSEELSFNSEPVFAFMLGANLGYQFTSVIGVKFYANYSYGKEEISSSGTRSDQKISYLNSGLALSITFD